jgi:hypothetical protein
MRGHIMTVSVGAEGSGEAQYAKFTERNAWESETWHFYIPVAGNEDAIAALRDKLADPKVQDPDRSPKEYELAEQYLPEGEVDILVRHGNSGYMLEHNKLKGVLNISNVGMIKRADDLYKGEIAHFMENQGE